MNFIEAITYQTKFATEPHLVIAIDGIPLDAILDAAFPHQQFDGLVSTLLDWMADDREHQIVWQRILPANGARSTAPILMCPDDCDFWCTVVLADVLATPETIHWQQIGIQTHKTTPDLLEQIGNDVEWFDGIGPFAFDRRMYTRMLDIFRCSAESNEAP